MGDVKFIRKNGHIIPIRGGKGGGKKSGAKKPKDMSGIKRVGKPVTIKQGGKSITMEFGERKTTALSRFKGSAVGGALIGGFLGGTGALDLPSARKSGKHALAAATIGTIGGAAIGALGIGTLGAAFGMRKEHFTRITKVTGMKKKKSGSSAY